MEGGLKSGRFSPEIVTWMGTTHAKEQQRVIGYVISCIPFLATHPHPERNRRLETPNQKN
jgi:hypothetical protein